MTKQLLLMRHAKSSWANGGLTDFERPLNKRGLRVAPQVAQFVKQQGLVPDLVVSSTAMRAKTTAQIFVENCLCCCLQQRRYLKNISSLHSATPGDDTTVCN